MQRRRMDRGLLNHYLYFLLLLSVAVVLLLRADFSPRDAMTVRGEMGQMHLAFWYPQSSDPLPLTGQWLGFPDQLLSPQEVRNNLQRSAAVSFPDIWQPPGPRRHVMTYTLQLKRIPQDQPLALKIPEIKNSFRLFLNDRQIATGGYTSDDSRLSRGYFGDRIVSLGKLPEQARLTLQVSNYGHSRGGVHHAPVLATEAYWSGYYRYNILIECVVISLALITGGLILLEFYLVPEHKELLWIALFALVLAGYTGTSGLGGLATLIPGLPWALAVRLEYIGFATAIPLFINWLAALYRDDVPRWLVQAVSLPSVAAVLYILLTPSGLFTATLPVLLGFMCLCLLATVVIMLRLFVRNRSGIRILIFGALALMLGIVHDLGVYLQLIRSTGILGTCVLIFLVSQIGFLTFYRTQEQLRILDLNHSLKKSTADLEQRIQWRKEELNARIRELEQRRQDYERLLSQDQLTGLLNRHHFIDLVERRLQRHRRFGFSILIVNVDQYKLIVDHHGREFAESVLQRLGGLLAELCEGAYDRIPARFGGDEFIIWLGRGDQREAQDLAREVRDAVARLRIPLLSSPGEVFRISVSTGIACCGEPAQDLYTMLARAADAVHQNRHLEQRPAAGKPVYPTGGIHDAAS